MKKIRFFVFNISILLILASCASSENPPVFQEFRVNGTATTSNQGMHNPSDIVAFSIDVTDNESLDSYTIKNESDGSALIGSGDLEGSSDNITFDFNVPANAQSGGSILITFIVIDNDGLSGFREYTISIP